MNIPGYDAWKLRTPEEDYEMSGGKICTYCGAYSTRSCEFEGDDCPWEDEQDEPDADYLRDLRSEREDF